MDHFNYQEGQLCAEDVSIEKIADDVKTPFYCYSRATIERHFRVFRESLKDLNPTICYAVKANSNIAVIKTLSNFGCGADVVSGGELKRALLGGVKPEKIVFSGVGKTPDEMRAALEAGILQINVESEPELEQLNQVALDMGVKAPIALRVNPDVDAKTHAKITTGKSENKFGIEWTRAHKVFAKADKMEGLDVRGVAVHIGSQLTDLEPFRDAYIRARDLVGMLRKDGIKIDRLDLGGGLGIPYEGMPTPGPEKYAEIVNEVIGDLDCQIIFEPGRVIMGNAGVLVTKVLYVKEGATKSFVIVDAAMNDLLRPSLYDAYHAILPVKEAEFGAHLELMDIVGPICETGDTFGKDRPLADVKAGDYLVIRTAGAYGAVMASTYNSRDLVPEVLVSGESYSLIRERITIDDLLQHETIPGWLEQNDRG